MASLGSAVRQQLDARQDVVLTVCAPRPRVADQAFTGAELHAAARERGAALLAATDGERPVVLAMSHGVDFIVSLLGAIHAGITVVPVALPRQDVQRDKFNRIVADCGAGAILCAGDALGPVTAARTSAAGDVSVLDVASLPAAGLLTEERPHGTRPAVIQYTSGSSRFPRGVRVTGANILANAERACTAWGFDRHQSVVNWLPHFHDMGLIGGILFPILAGGASFQMDPLVAIQRPARWLRTIADTGATFSGGPAFGFAHCLQTVRDEECEGLDLSRWVGAFCGAEPVPAALLRAFRERFARWGLDGRAVFGSYGLAEYTLMAAGRHRDAADPPQVPPPGCADVAPCRLDAALAGTLRIVDPERRTVLADGQAGEIWLCGASVADGYVGGDDDAVFGARLADDPAGARWLRTGDLGVIAGGDLYVTGRLKDVLTVMGRKVAAAEVEWLAAAQEPSLNPMAAAAVMPDEQASGSAVLLIELRRARQALADPDALRDRIRQRAMGAWGIALVDIRFLERGTLPRTSSGKIRRRAAADDYRAGRFDPVAA